MYSILKLIAFSYNLFSIFETWANENKDERAVKKLEEKLKKTEEKLKKAQEKLVVKLKVKSKVIRFQYY